MSLSISRKLSMVNKFHYLMVFSRLVVCHNATVFDVAAVPSVVVLSGHTSRALTPVFVHTIPSAAMGNRTGLKPVSDKSVYLRTSSGCSLHY